MRLFEFDSSDPLRVKLTAVTSQLKARIGEEGSTKPMSTDSLLSLLKNNDIIIDKSDIYDMVKKEPLSNMIDDIRDDQVVFKGQKPMRGTMTPDNAEKIVSQMAKKAASK